MTEEMAREELKIWASTDFKAPKKAETPMKLKNIKEQFLKRNGIAIALIAAFALQGFTVAKVTERITEERVRTEVTSELRAGFARYLEQMEEEAAAAQFLSGDASLQAAMESEADALARLLYGYRNNSLRDRRTLIWCVLARVDSKAYPNTVEDVVAQSKQWMFYKSDNPLRADDREVALEQLKEWHGGVYPAGFSSDFVYAEWSEHDIVLRNEFQTSSKTAYWRYPE